MSWFLLEPRDPLMVRDGRPFGLDTDGARSLDFPPCSVTAGALRTRVGFAVGGGHHTSSERVQFVRRIAWRNFEKHAIRNRPIAPRLQDYHWSPNGNQQAI